MSIIPNNAGTAAQMPDGILGVTDGSSASAGNIGETIESVIATGSAVALTVSGTSYNITSISLTNGDWELSGIINFIPAASTTVTKLKAASSRTSATLPSSTTAGAPNANGEQISQFSQASAAPGDNISVPLTPCRVSVSGGSVTQYLVANATFAASTITANGTLHARRIR